MFSCLLSPLSWQRYWGGIVYYREAEMWLQGVLLKKLGEILHGPGCLFAGQREKVALCQGSNSQLRSGLGCSHSLLWSICCLHSLPGSLLTLRHVLLQPASPSALGAVTCLAYPGATMAEGPSPEEDAGKAPWRQLRELRTWCQTKDGHFFQC